MVISTTALFAALATVVTVGVLAWVLRPVWRDRKGAWATGVLLLAVATLALYRLVGTPAALELAQQPHAASPLAAAGTPQSLEEAVAQLRTELERNPAQPEGWALLARSLTAMGDQESARDAYAFAVQLAPDQPALLVEAAESRAMADPQRRFDEQAVTWLRRALELEPGHQRGTWFLGVAQRQARQPVEAALTWESLLGQVDEATANSLRVQINEARAEAGLPPLPAAVAGATGTAPASTTVTDGKTPAAAGAAAAGTTAAVGAEPASANALTVRVSLDPAVAGKLPDEATVFVMARPVDGPPMPVAAERHAVRDLPLQVLLDDADSPMPTLKLSEMQEVVLLARVSASGSANRGDGDLESAPVRVTLPASGPIELVIGAPAK